jgi:hypothetical protein
MSSKHFIWIVRVSFYLWEFSWNVENSLSTFCALKTFSSLYWNCFRIEKQIQKIKGNLIPSVWAEPRSRPISVVPAPGLPMPFWAQDLPVSTADTTVCRRQASCLGMHRPASGMGWNGVFEAGSRAGFIRMVGNGY